MREKWEKKKERERKPKTEEKWKLKREKNFDFDVSFFAEEREESGEKQIKSTEKDPTDLGILHHSLIHNIQKYFLGFHVDQLIEKL